MRNKSKAQVFGPSNAIFATGCKRPLGVSINGYSGSSWPVECNSLCLRTKIRLPDHERENALSLKAVDFIARWQQSSAAERANYALFLSELCDYLDMPRPEPSQADESANKYVIDKAVFLQNLDGSTTPNYIDLYKRGCFVLEAKQGSNPLTNSPIRLSSPKEPHRMKKGTAVRGTHGWDEAMLAARGQAERYAKALPVSEGWPPFLVVVDVGHSIELFADFSLTGKAYLPFPDPRTFRILFENVDKAEVRDRLRAVWLDPLSLDPSRETAKVTREVAGKLAVLARNLESHYPPKQVAEFLIRSNPSNTRALPSTRINSSALNSIPVLPSLPISFSGSATCNGISAPVATHSRPSPSSATFTISSRPTLS